MLLVFVSNAGRQTCVTPQSPLVRNPCGGFHFPVVCLIPFMLLVGV